MSQGLEVNLPSPDGRAVGTAQVHGSSPVGHMRRALALAERGRGRVSPNPLVGCVFVTQDGAVVGEGWHAQVGGPHAEVEALRSAGAAAHGATAYVTLEPCDHYGRTGPCTDALTEAGVARVVVAMLDPDPRVAGRGIAKLRSAGITVEVGLLAGEAEALNEPYLTSQRTKRPFVLYKTAMSLDGKIAVRSGRSRWITSAASRERVQRWRDEFDAVAVGVNTVLLDDPALTARFEGARTPVKVIFDSVARTPPGSRLFEPGPDGAAARVLVYVTEEAPRSRIAALEERAATVVPVAGTRGRPRLADVMSDLKTRDIGSLLLEGGGTLAWDFFAERVVDRVAWFIAPKLLGGNAASPLAGAGVASIPEAFTLEDMRTETIGPDLLVTGRVVYPAEQDPQPELESDDDRHASVGGA
ncbi:MAG TPA: bifunctional diaminohydroxyphosphoribosylaminopyrimidine deaminase/5-amino-6-(5-phosphoribosylamino)uracil reductase RibD [Trueperaceae bacterium]|nr:bifunctional diaminohydroxyphosphoribosylaminopyrimidine deaminase/5-amino-6-(5-phosphoribosylamino)uracil reductase RibD [Trueperaceae bacterium]